MSLPPNDWTEDLGENPTPEPVRTVEWENPEWSSLWAFLTTLRRLLFTPGAFFTELPLTGGLGEPLGFALLVGTIGILGSLLWQLILEGDFSATMPAVALSKHVGNFMQNPKVVIGIFMLTPFLVALGQFFLSVCLLGAVRLTTSGKNTFESVFRVAAYAQAPAVLCLIPWGGAFIAAFWNIALLVIGIAKKFGSSVFKALFTLFLAAVFQGLLLFLFLLLAGILGFWSLLVS
jgi:hypothetical protein